MTASGSDWLASYMWEIATTRELTLRQVRVAMVVWLRLYDVPDSYGISAEAIAEQTGIRVDKVRRILLELEDLGLVYLTR